MRIKNVVQVMYFHSLLRVDKAIKKANSFRDVGEEITKLMSRIIYNKNLVLDKKVLIADPSRPKLNIYIANDYGFCGNFNSQIRHQIMLDKDDNKIIVGKKIPNHYKNVILKIEKDDFEKRFKEIEKTIDKSILESSYGEINLYYNHYYSSTSFDFLKITLFPLEFSGKYYEGEDFIHETDITKMLKSLLAFYICFELKICESNSSAAENIIRSQITKIALDKIKEKEEEIKSINLKKEKEKTILKTVENYKKVVSGGIYEREI